MNPTDPFGDFNDVEKTVVRPSPGRRRQAPAAVRTPRAIPPNQNETQFMQTALSGDNPLVVGACALLSLVPKLRNSPFHDAVNVLRERLIEGIQTFESQTLGKSISRNQVEIAKYLICSLLDETVLNTPWGSQSGWGHNSLSSLFYKDVSGGKEFFQILNRIKQQPTENKALLELAYLCLSLGFEGKYRYTNNGLMTLERERQEVFLLVQRMKGDTKPSLSTHWQGIQNRQNPLIRHVPLWVLGGIASVLLMFIYMAFASSIRYRSDHIYDQLFAMGQGIEATQLSQIVRPLETRPAATVLSISGLQQLFADEIARKLMDVTDGPGLRLFNVFQSGNAEIRAEYQAVLAKIADVLRTKSTRVTITGHTDNQRLKFSSRYKSNWHLSVARAQSTAQALTNYGLPEQRMTFEGKADKEPIASNTTKEGRALNRRIDIHIR